MSVRVWADEGLDVPDIARDIVDGIKNVPIIFAIFLVVGGISALTNAYVEFLLLEIGISVGVIIFYQSFEKDIETDTSIPWRIGMATVADIIALLPLFFVFVLAEFRLIAALLLFLPALYVYARLIIAIPSVMIEGNNAFEALADSWNTLEGSILAVCSIIALSFITQVVIIAPVYFFTNSDILSTSIGTVIAGVANVGIISVLYHRLNK